MIIIYTGNGKGKTTAAIGAALRAIANKKKVVIVQFLKPGTSSEIKLLKNGTMGQCYNFLPEADPPMPKAGRPLTAMAETIHSFGKKAPTNPAKLTKKDFEIVEKALEFTLTSIEKKPFLIILDEILVALKFKLLIEKQVMEIIRNCKANKIHLILTGRYATKRLIEKADIVTEMRNVKHHFDKGAKAVKGIDF